MSKWKLLFWSSFRGVCIALGLRSRVSRYSNSDENKNKIESCSLFLLKYSNEWVHDEENKNEYITLYIKWGSIMCMHAKCYPDMKLNNKNTNDNKLRKMAFQWWKRKLQIYKWMKWKNRFIFFYCKWLTTFINGNGNVCLICFVRSEKYTYMWMMNGDDQAITASSVLNAIRHTSNIKIIYYCFYFDSNIQFQLDINI